RNLAVAHMAGNDRLGRLCILANDRRGVVPAKGPAAVLRLAAGAGGNVALAPADATVAVAGLDDDRFELGEGTIGEHIRPDQRQTDFPQREFLQFHWKFRSWRN